MKMPNVSVVAGFGELRLTKHRTEIAERLRGERVKADTVNLSFWRFPRMTHDEFIVLRFTHTELANRVTLCEPEAQHEFAYALCDLAQRYSNGGERLELEFEWSSNGQQKRLWIVFTQEWRHAEVDHMVYEIRISLI